MRKLTFHNTPIRIIDRNGALWLPAADIARALYGSKGGSQNDTPFETRIRKLYARHSEEFTDRMTSLVEVPTAGGIQTVRVFSLRGAHLLGMLARSERAKEFRRWVLDTIERHYDETGALVTQYHQALARLEAGQSAASACGRGLNRWRREKQFLRCEVEAIARKVQPSLFQAA